MSNEQEAEHVAIVGEMRNDYKIFIGKSEGKRSRRRWDDNIKMDFWEIGWGGVEWIYLTQDRDQ
jgi:hypothetical protein